MDRDLMRQSLNFHGPSLLSLLRSEQQDNPHFRSLLGSVVEPARGPPPQQQLQGRKEKKVENIEIQKFISKKADLLFAVSWKSDAPTTSEVNEDDEERYAVMPPLEQFMEIPSMDRRELFFRDIERGDIVIGRISSIREFGFFMVLICLGSGIMRDISHLEITALCPLRDVPSLSNHGDPLSYYQTGDLVRAGIKDIDRYHEKLAVSLYSSSLPPHLSGIKLGVISSEELPLYYRRSVELNSNSSESYENIMQSSLGFVNPGVVEFLLGKLGIDESNPPSLMRGLQSKNFSEDDFASALRKKQSASWALKCVKIGVDYFKVGRHVDAMNEYNKALEIDKQNVEALVARGALYATKGSLNKAIEDFELALENCPTHRNARKYLCQTLVERGGQLEEEEKFLNAESYYKKALALDETFKDAEDALQKLHKYMQKSLELREKQAEKEEKQKTRKIETSAEKLRKLLKEEKRLKKKRRKSTSSSSSVSSADESVSSSSSSSSGHKRHKKHKRNRSESSRSSKRHSAKASSNQVDQNKKDECFPVPANTSASFLNQKQEVEKLLEKQDRLPYQKKQVKEKDRCPLSSSSVEIPDDFGGRSEDPRDFYNSYKTQTGSSKTEKPHKSERHFSSRRDSSDSFYRNSEDKIKIYGYRRFEKDTEGRKEHYRRWEPGSMKYSTSPASSDYSWKSVEKYKKYTYSGSRDFSRHEQRYQLNKNQGEYEREGNYEEDIKTEVPEEGLSSKEHSESGVKKNLPQNLLNIFNQIAAFEKEKGNKPKN
ncbi:tetratricopeptide repeat protein 14 isoform X1 [Neophocaena asiaeorientalis asiaeorientalis]|uniref:Tetratricopeptide repeat protein 14 isoform X1 n=2 Tax=Neophocaena asiaeorientalis asiaeorientalis TaxID=1706337 RepID=A0A341D8W3_NEOAA|nr:tetratricopeptide repeat protein 14 isoform X1 [Neophocaena asiaeorientalis asiaeorientalis]